MIIAIIIAAVLLLAIIAVFFLYHIGMISFYHPMNKPAEHQIKVACVGDSITYGCMVGGWRKNNYPAVLGDLLGEKYCVNNFGYTNRTAIKSADYPYTSERLYQQSLDFDPDIVLLLLGTNDSKRNNWDKAKYLNDLSEIIDRYLALNPKVKVYLLVPPPVFEIKGKVLYQLRKAVIDREICPAVKDVAAQKGVECIDLYSIFQNKRELFADGVHPNARGSRMLAQTIYKTITE